MAAAAVSMCPPAGLLLGVNRFCARSLVCARGGVPCVLGGLGVFIFYGALRNRGAFLGLSLGLALYTARSLPAYKTQQAPCTTQRAPWPAPLFSKKKGASSKAASARWCAPAARCVRASRFTHHHRHHHHHHRDRYRDDLRRHSHHCRRCLWPHQRSPPPALRRLPLRR